LMFFLITLTKSLLLHPSTFGPNLHNEIKKTLYAEVEGKVDPKHGYIIYVSNIFPIPAGEVEEGGYARFNVIYKAIVFRVFRNEVIDAVVTSIDSLGFRCNAGPLSIFVYKDQIPQDYQYDPSSAAYVQDERQAKIGVGDHTRIKITGWISNNEIFAVGTIKEDYLGPI